MISTMNVNEPALNSGVEQRTVVGVMGGASAPAHVLDMAQTVGELIAGQNWVLLTGGRIGVMEAASRGAAQSGGLVIGMLPSNDRHQANPWVHIALPTGIGNARNVVNVTACSGIIAIGGGAGTLSEIALALKAGRPVVGLHSCNFSYAEGRQDGRYYQAQTPQEAVAALALMLQNNTSQEDVL